MSLIYDDPRMDKAVEFCWETQRMITAAKFYGWQPQRTLAHLESRKQQWRKFPSGVRTTAHTIFMEQLNEQIRRPKDERDIDRPVWVNEQAGWIAPDAGPGQPAVDGGATPNTLQRGDKYSLEGGAS